MPSLRIVLGIAFATLVAALVPASAGASDTSAAAKSEVMRRSAEWSAAAQARDVEKVVAFWADDAVVLPPGGPAISGKAAIRDYVVKSFQTPGFGISWKAESAVVSGSGDLAWARESNRVTFTGPDGKPIAVDGKAITVWRKGKDGIWRCVADIWNDDAAPRP
ncbi:MAG TPA: SgcJ/EcaC family oxidoreductase [Thermoanaerobaculia bacterium]|nr:SgcJ/EcaC family oxidoreductase [Thermoanaerobaculia bacterium]